MIEPTICTTPIPPESPPLYYFTSALIDFSSSPNLKRAEELTKQGKVELPPMSGSRSDVESGTDITRSMIRDTSSNKIFLFSLQKCSNILEAFLVSLRILVLLFKSYSNHSHCSDAI